MARLIVRNSSLVYPPVPDQTLRDDDITVPLVDRFEDAVFMAGPGYDELRALFPRFSLDIRAAAREIAEALPPWLGQDVHGFGHCVWETHADHFVNFSLGPILAGDFIARHAIEMGPDEVLGWELDHTEGWWAGRQMVAEVARVIADEAGVPVELSGSEFKRACRDTILPAARVVQALRRLRALRTVALDRPDLRVDVLFVISGPTVVPMYDRIGARLQAEHGLRVAALDCPLGGPSNQIAPGELPRWSLHAFSEPWMVRRGVVEALNASKQFAETAERLSEWPIFVDLPRPLQEGLARRLHSTMVAELPRSLYTARLWRAALDALRPRALVSFNSYNDALAPGVLQSRHRGIPTICLQHGIWGPLFRAGALLPHDDICIFGDYALEMLSPLASAHTTFAQTGHCMYDDLTRSVASGDIRQRLLGSRRHLVVATTQPIESRLMVNERRWWLRGLAMACAHCDAVLAIKPHPHEGEYLRTRYEALAAELPETVRLVPHGEVPLSDLIAASDLLVTRFSTTTFEAALLGRPVMTVNLSGGPDQYPFADEGCALGVRDYDEIERALRRLLSRGEMRGGLAKSQLTFLRRHLGPRDGRSTERIARLIARRAQQR
ncbi:MAG: CDP-glycerol glycerophosphotransferase family protein [Armatimonadota bacterium]|jgi:hypothetical protein